MGVRARPDPMPWNLCGVDSRDVKCSLGTMRSDHGLSLDHDHDLGRRLGPRLGPPVPDLSLDPRLRPAVSDRDYGLATARNLHSTYTSICIRVGSNRLAGYAFPLGVHDTMHREDFRRVHGGIYRTKYELP